MEEYSNNEALMRKTKRFKEYHESSQFEYLDEPGLIPSPLPENPDYNY
jgi:hypothetical protein